MRPTRTQPRSPLGFVPTAARADDAAGQVSIVVPSWRAERSPPSSPAGNLGHAHIAYHESRCTERTWHRPRTDAATPWGVLQSLALAAEAQACRRGRPGSGAWPTRAAGARTAGGRGTEMRSPGLPVITGSAPADQPSDALWRQPDGGEREVRPPELLVEPADPSARRWPHRAVVRSGEPEAGMRHLTPRQPAGQRFSLTACQLRSPRSRPITIRRSPERPAR
ncbi:MAG: hypothetical protein JWR81_5570 [Pseudonocardia sp.]|nr:hypothetical protein [Pseudonocardia sp.]